MHGKPPFRCTRVGHGDFAEASFSTALSPMVCTLQSLHGDVAEGNLSTAISQLGPDHVGFAVHVLRQPWRTHLPRRFRFCIFIRQTMTLGIVQAKLSIGTDGGVDNVDGATHTIER